MDPHRPSPNVIPFQRRSPLNDFRERRAEVQQTRLDWIASLLVFPLFLTSVLAMIFNPVQINAAAIQAPVEANFASQTISATSQHRHFHHHSHTSIAQGKSWRKLLEELEDSREMDDALLP